MWTMLGLFQPITNNTVCWNGQNSSGHFPWFEMVARLKHICHFVTECCIALFQMKNVLLQHLSLSHWLLICYTVWTNQRASSMSEIFWKCKYAVGSIESLSLNSKMKYQLIQNLCKLCLGFRKLIASDSISSWTCSIPLWVIIF